MIIQAHNPDGLLIAEGTQQHVNKVIAARPKGQRYIISIKPSLSATQKIAYYGKYTSTCVDMSGRRSTGYKF